MRSSQDQSYNTDEPSKWDKIADVFKVVEGEAMAALAADNVEIAWPVILKELPKTGNILDFGCGTGGFCQRLQDLI